MITFIYLSCTPFPFRHSPKHNCHTFSKFKIRLSFSVIPYYTFLVVLFCLTTMANEHGVFLGSKNLPSGIQNWRQTEDDPINYLLCGCSSDPHSEIGYVRHISLRGVKIFKHLNRNDIWLLNNTGSVLRFVVYICVSVKMRKVRGPTQWKVQNMWNAPRAACTKEHLCVKPKTKFFI